MEIGSKGYILPKANVDKNHLALINKELKVTPYIVGDFGQRPKPFKVYTEDDTNYYLPRYWGIKHFGIPKTINYEHSMDSMDMTFNGDLRPYQQEIINKLDKVFYTKDKLNKYGGGVVSIPPGGGKTVIAISYACKLNLKTLIIVHKSFLLDQWVERLQQYTDTSIGIIRQDKVQVEKKEVVIAMLQTLLSRDYDDILKQFPVVIFDEAHHLAAEAFSQVLQKTCAPYMIGLTATPERSDRLEKIFYWNIGELQYRSEQKKETRKAIVKMYYFRCEDPKFKSEFNKWNQKINMPKMITNIVEIKERNDLIINIIKETLENEPERKIFVLTNRRAHIDDLHQRLKDIYPDDVGLYIGGMKKEKLKESEEKTIILGTYEMASEGLDIQDLDTLILATPKSDIVQSIGRIMRKEEADYINIPLIVDIVDRLDVFYGMSYKRKRIYTQNKYEIQTFNLGKSDQPIIQPVNNESDEDSEKDLFDD